MSELNYWQQRARNAEETLKVIEDKTKDIDILLTINGHFLWVKKELKGG